MNARAALKLPAQLIASTSMHVRIAVESHVFALEPGLSGTLAIAP